MLARFGNPITAKAPRTGVAGVHQKVAIVSPSFYDSVNPKDRKGDGYED